MVRPEPFDLVGHISKIIRIIIGHNFAASGSDGVKFETVDDVNRDFNSPWKRYGQVCFIHDFALRVRSLIRST